MNFKSLSSHVRQTHNISVKDYYDKFLKNDKEGLCIICNNQTNFANINHGYYKFCSSIICINNDPKRISMLKTRIRSKEELSKMSKMSKSTKNQWKTNKEYIKLMTTPGNKYRKKLGKIIKERYKDPKERLKTSKAIKEAYKKNPELRIQASNHSKKLWNDPNGPFSENSPYWTNLYNSLTKKGPNYAEKIILKILNELYPNEYRYVGDFEFWVGRKNPDFLCFKKKENN